MPVDLGRAAEWYASVLSWPVIPLHTALEGGRCSCGLVDCGSVAKHPRTRHGAHEGTTDLKKIRAWWREWPDANIGVLTGAASGVIVIDIDPRNGGNGTYTGLRREHGRGDLGFVARTGGGGRHIFYDYVDEPVIYRPGAGIEVKSDNGYVVVAPSMHASGQRYKWQDKPSVNSVLGTAPWWALDGHTARNSSNGTKAPVDMKRVIRDGERDNELTRVAGRMRRIGMNETEINAALSKHNQMYCEPPKPESDVRRIARSAMRWQPDAKASATEIDAPADYALRRANVVSITKLLSRKMEEHQYILDPLCPLEGLATLVADSGSYKTWWLLDLALAVGNGLGEKYGMPIKRTGRVLVIEAELPPSELQRRVQALIVGSRGAYKKRGVDFLERRFDINDMNSVSELMRAVEKRPYSLIIGDSLSKMHTGEESSPAFMTQTMLALRQVEQIMKQKHNAPSLFLLSHHMRKFSADGGNTIGQRSRGASSIKDNVASMFGLSRQRSGKSKLIHEKNWFGMEAEPIMIWVEDVVVDNQRGVVLKSGPVADENDSKPMTKPEAAALILSMYLGSNIGATVSRQDILQELMSQGVGNNTARDSLEKALEEGLLQETERHGKGGSRSFLIPDDDETAERLYADE